jgi:hypothetical protein
MPKKEFNINKGVGKPMEFKGFSGIYLTVLGITLFFTFLLFVILYMSGVPMLFTFVAAAGLGGGGFYAVSTLSRKHGPQGLQKMASRVFHPKRLKFSNPATFHQLNHPYGKQDTKKNN